MGPLDDDLDESQGVVVVAQPALRLATLNVVARDPSFVVLAVHETEERSDIHCVTHPCVCNRRGDSLGDAAALGEVVVVGTRVVGLDVAARRCCRGRIWLPAVAWPLVAARRSSKAPEIALGPPEWAAGV